MKNQQVINTAIQKVNTQHISVLSVNVSLYDANRHVINYKLIPPSYNICKIYIRKYYCMHSMLRFFMSARRISSRAFVVTSGFSDVCYPYYLLPGTNRHIIN